MRYLNLETNGPVAEKDETLKEGLRQARTSGLFIHNSRGRVANDLRGASVEKPSNTVSLNEPTSNHDKLLHSKCEWDHALGLGLSQQHGKCLKFKSPVSESARTACVASSIRNGPKLELGQSRISTTHHTLHK